MKFSDALNHMKTIYIDFEGNKAGELFLFGFDRGEGYQVWVLLDDLQGWAAAKGFYFATATEVLDLINQHQLIIAYSQAERATLNQLATAHGSSLAEHLKYLDARKLCVACANSCRKTQFDQLPDLGTTLSPQSRPRKKALISMARLVGLDCWRGYGFGHVMKRIQQVRTGLLAKDGQYSKLTAHQKRQASKVITHNIFDIEAMRLLVETALSERPTLYKRYMTPLLT